MKELIFRLRVFRFQTVVTGGYYTEASYEVDCMSFRSWPLNHLSFTERFEGGKDQVNEEFERHGWKKAGTWDYLIFIIPLPITGHELAELPKGTLSRYWTPESLLDLFNQANAEFSNTK